MPKPYVLEQLDGKAPLKHTHTLGDTTGLREHVDDKLIHFGLSSTENVDGTLYRGTKAPTGTQKLNYSGYFQATRVLGAYFSDYAECFNVKGDVMPGQVVMICGEDEYKVADVASTPRAIGIVSDEYYMCIGQKENSTNIPIALCGKVHAFIDGECEPGDFLVCSGKNGALRAWTGSRRPAFGAVVAQALTRPDKDTGKALVTVTRR